MDEVTIYLNKYTKSTLLVFFLMGFTYLFLGISSIINSDLLIGSIQLFISVFALIFLLASSLPSNSFKLYYSIDKEKISIRSSFIFKEKVYKWDDIVEVVRNKNEFIIVDKKGKGHIRLSALNYNELQLFLTTFTKFVQDYNINFTSQV